MNPEIEQKKIWDRVRYDHGCWTWSGGTSGPYGRVRVGAKSLGVHRLVYELLVGPAHGMDIDHLCRNTLCVNPAHMEAVSRRENLSRGAPNNWQQAAAQTHCKHGHEFTPGNTHITATDRRSCRTCATERMRRRRSGWPK